MIVPSHARPNLAVVGLSVEEKEGKEDGNIVKSVAYFCSEKRQHVTSFFLLLQS